ncbi:hypothetical protein MGSAQ_000207 [marine sediment metagenome]|uniref:Uncharacterized protein n=1 Tax=marine sediment metagenome TaxID=412755 RepID=A0A1B6NY19_9ZZZZ
MFFPRHISFAWNMCLISQFVKFEMRVALLCQQMVSIV